MWDKGKVTERGWLWFQGYSLTVLAIVTVIYIYSHPNEHGDSQGIILAVLGFLSAIIIGIYASAKISNAAQNVIQESRNMITDQNVVLNEIKTKTNGATEKLLKEQADKHAAELLTAEAKAADERHRRDGEIASLKLQLEAKEGDLKAENARHEAALKTIALLNQKGIT